MKTKQREKGITLLTLIITVILLLIVSGVTLNIALGENGLLKKSKEAVNKSRLAQREEAIKMDLLSAYIDAELTGLDKPSSETIKEIVEKHGGTIDESNPNIVKTPDGEIKLDSILNESSSSTQNPGEINKTVEELNNQINELKSQLETERQAKQELENQVTELNTQVASWKKKAEDGDVTIAERDSQISNLNSQITTKNEEIATKEQTISTLEDNVETLTTQVNNLNTRIAELEGKQATGTAIARDVLSGKTFSNGSGVGLTGTMANKGTLNKVLKEDESVTLEAGYYSGGTISMQLGKSIETVKEEIERDGLASHLGDLVDYTPEGKGKWRVFYYNTEEEWGDPAGTLYLKRDYDDSLLKTLPTSTATTNGTDYMKKMNPLWAASENATSIDLDNEKAVAWLCDPDNWTKYKTSVATYAIGSPSVEMYMKSYNIWKNSSNALTCGIKNAYGYGVAANGGTLSDTTPYNAVDAGPGSMYMTKGVGKEWWLASPGFQPNFVICLAGGVSYVSRQSCGNSDGVCPIVSINP